MMKLERLEKGILIFLIAALVLGIAVSFVRKLSPPPRILIERFNPADYSDTQSSLYGRYEKININTASAEELMKIKGVGVKIAGRIIEYRYQHGRFDSIDDLKNVKGISVSLFEKLRPRVTVE